MIVTVTPTVQDGTVVRWYVSEGAAEYGTEQVSASRNGVLIQGYLHLVPADVLAKAKEVHEILRDNGPRELVTEMATHRRHRGGLVPVGWRS